MRYISVFLFVLLAYSVAGAQTLGKFYIGAFWVAGNAVEDDTIRQPNSGPVATYNTSPPTLVSSHLPRSRFDELDMGRSLMQCTVDLTTDGFEQPLDLKGINAGVYLLTLGQGNAFAQQKLLVF